MQFQELLDQFAEAARTQRDKGTLFERLIARYLTTDPEYAALFGHDVWQWSEWSPRTTGDIGIDLVAREQASGAYWAIQCKFYREDTTLDDIATFLAASGKRYTNAEGEITFARRMIVTTTDRWSSNADKAIENQTIPVTVLTAQDIAASPIDWDEFSLTHDAALRLKPKYDPKPHQQDAIKAVLDGFRRADRGKLIMACGTGKTFTALRLAEDLGTRRTLFLAPSISLVSQTLREWTAQAHTPLHAIVVCSDAKTAKDEDDLRLIDVPFPVTTDPQAIARAARAIEALPDFGRLAVFSTYQSIQAIADAQRAGLSDFDLVICDEAHRTTGIELAGKDTSEFNKIHHNQYVRVAKRLYMTATPRIYNDATRTRALEKAAVVYDMDDKTIYGETLHRLSFGKAVDAGQLTEYKVLIVAVREEEMSALANQYNTAHAANVLTAGKAVIDLSFAKKIIGSWKGLSKKGLVVVDEIGEADLTEDTAPMRRAVAFCNSIKASKETRDTFGTLVQFYRKALAEQDLSPDGMIECRFEHVDGSMNALKRMRLLDWLRGDKQPIPEGECRILTNARCLSEGIDVPALDAVVFFDTRDSMVDIVQSVGRVMRKAEGKQYGYIILPVCIPDSSITQFNAYLDNSEQFKGVWKVLKALRAHDERLVDETEFRRRVQVSDGRGRGERKKRKGGEDDGPRNLELGFDFVNIPLKDMNEAVYAAIPKKLGDREYWAEWAKGIGEIAKRLIARIEDLMLNPVLAAEFATFLKGLQDTLNPGVTRDEAVEMLAQHILTEPIFRALFAHTDFPEHNAVGKALQAIVAKFDAAAVASETESLAKFYEVIRDRIALAKSDKSKQDIIRNLYDTFFQNAFPRMHDRLGIVYTPVEVVDFILHSVQAALVKHFGATLDSPGVHILDPFSGTGTFPVRLIQSGLIDPDKLPPKYAGELHANELVLLAYYIASINIETAYHAATGEYRPFDGMVLADTFQMTEKGDLVDEVVLPENTEKAKRQLAQPIQVIVGNPPYSVGQGSENDNNKNLVYPTLDDKIRRSYAEKSSAKLVRNLYDSYIRAIRWASDRIKECGIVAFVTNGSFINSNNMDGLRKCLTEDFTHLYVFDLRGNQRTSGEASKREGGKIFKSGSRAPIAITIMVMAPAHSGPHELYYHDIGDYLSLDEKLKIIETAGSIDGLDWLRIQPNADGDWINQRDLLFDTFMCMGDKETSSGEVLFGTYSLGVSTNRDPWTYNSSRVAVEANMRRMIEVFLDESARYSERCQDIPKEKRPKVEEVVAADPRRISWTVNLKTDIERGKVHEFEPSCLRRSMYRPFNKQWLYFNRKFNERVFQMPRLFPTSADENVVISCTGVADRKGFTVLATDHLPSLHLTDTGQCFPLYWYEESKAPAAPTGGLFDDAGQQPDEHGFIRRDALTDWALAQFRQHYRDERIGKEDIFWYVYGILHAPDYKTRFAADLKKRLPRIPFAGDFWAFSGAGRALGKLHIGYETTDPYPLVEEKRGIDIEPKSFYRVTKMAFGKKDGKPDQSVIVFNANLTLRGIPQEAYKYVVNGRSAIAWIMERYQVMVDKASGIKNDPNDGADDPRYIVDLLKRIVTVSLETVTIVQGLPPIGGETERK